MIMKSKLTNNILFKGKSWKQCQNPQKLAFINSLTVIENVSTQKSLITHTYIIIISNLKKQKRLSYPSLIEVFNRYKNKDIYISKIDLLVE